MARNRKVTPEMVHEIVDDWLAWKLDTSPFKDQWSGKVQETWDISYTTAYKKIPEHLKRASREELKRYQRVGWERPLHDINGDAVAEQAGQAAVANEMLGALLRARDELTRARERVAALEMFIRTHSLRVPK